MDFDAIELIRLHQAWMQRMREKRRSWAVGELVPDLRHRKDLQKMVKRSVIKHDVKGKRAAIKRAAKRKLRVIKQKKR